MQTKICYQTCDGVIHTDVRSASRHADKRYGEVLCALAHRLLTIEKYRSMVDFLDQYDFSTLIRLKEDQTIIPLEGMEGAEQ